MANIGDYVKINESYAGNLESVIGRVGKVVAKQGDVYALDIRAYKKNQDHRYWDYDVMVKDGEFDVRNPEFKDSKGQLVEIGDTVVYGPLGGGVRMGRVVDIREVEMTYSYSSHTYKKVRVRVELDSERYFGDTDRSIRIPNKTYRWYDDSSRMLVIQKGSLRYLSSLSEDDELLEF